MNSLEIYSLSDQKYTAGQTRNINLKPVTAEVTEKGEREGFLCRNMQA